MYVSTATGVIKIQFSTYGVPNFRMNYCEQQNAIPTYSELLSLWTFSIIQKEKKKKG
jgi:hypothetical protein